MTNIGESIWFCTGYNEGGKVIAEYNTIKCKCNVTAYPQDLGIIYGYSCCNDQSMIYIVNELKGELDNI